MFRNRRWIFFAIGAFVLFNVFSRGHDAREEQRAYQDGYVAGQMAALTAQGNNATGTVPPVMNPYAGYERGWNNRGGGPGFFPGFLFLPLLIIGGFALMRLRRHRMWAQHAGWQHGGPDGQGFEGRGPWGGPDPRGFGGRGPWGRGGPRGFRGGPGSNNVGGGYWWRDGDTPPTTPERPVQPKPQPTEDAGGEDASI